MKVAILVSDLINSGGGARQVVYLAHELQRAGHSVAIFTPRFEKQLCFPEVTAGLQIIQTGGVSIPFVKNARLIAIAKAVKCFWAIRNERSDVINVHSWPFHWIVFWSNRGRKVPLVYSHTETAFRPEDSIARRFLHIIERKAIQKVDRVVTIDLKVREEVRSYYNVHAEVVRSGVDVEKLSNWQIKNDIRTKYGFAHESFLLFFQGFLFPHRRVEDVIDAVKILRNEGADVSFLIGGSTEANPDYSYSLRARVRDLQLNDRIKFAGWLDESETIDCYHASDAFVWPCVNQTWGLAAVEAMACGTPVIASTDTGVSEIITDYKNGLLVRPRSPKDIADKIRILLSDNLLRKSISMQGRDYVIKNFSWKKYASEMAEIFQSLVQSGRRYMARGLVQSSLRQKNSRPKCY